MTVNETTINERANDMHKGPGMIYVKQFKLEN